MQSVAVILETFADGLLLTGLTRKALLCRHCIISVTNFGTGMQLFQVPHIQLKLCLDSFMLLPPSI